MIIMQLRSEKLSMNDDLSWDSTPEITFTNDPLAKAPFAACSNCPLLAFPCVSSFKPTGAISLIVVGEAPGWHEVQANQPFVGPSGKLLSAVLEHIEIDPNTVYKTNAVLCRPPDNKLDRYPGAVTACAERLRYELAQIDCNEIVALGNKAVQVLDAHSNRADTNGIIKRHGQWYPYGTDQEDDRSYIAAYHPAFILRSAGYMASFLTDMRSLTIDRDPDKWLNIKYTIVNANNFSMFTHLLYKAQSTELLCAFDTETPNLKDRNLLALGFAFSDNAAWIIPGAYFQASKLVRDILDSFFAQATTVAHNAKFDQQVLVHNGLKFFSVTHDTMLQHYVLDEQKGTHGLKQLLTSFCGVPDYESEFIDKHFRSIDRDKRDYSTIPTEDLYKYLAIDCCGTLALRRVLAAMIEADNLTPTYQVCMDASNALVQTELAGIKVDVPYLKRVHYHLVNAIGEAESNVQLDARDHTQHYLDTVPSTQWQQIAKLDWIKSVDHYRSYLDKIMHGSISNSGGKKRKLTGVNLSSWQQMSILLYDVLGLKHIKKLSYKTDPRSTNAEALDALEYHPFVGILQEFRRLDKIRGTYVEKLLALADSNDRVHIQYNIHGTETSRLSANDGLHGIPRPSDQWGKALRSSFVAKPDYKIGKCDYAQGELRIFAALSQEDYLLDMFANGEDPHGNVTLMVFGDSDPRFKGMTKESYNKVTEKWSLPQIDGFTQKDQESYWKEKRTTGKNVVFGGLLYLGGANGIVGMIRAQTGKDVDVKVVDYVLKSMLAKMPKAAAWQLNQFRTARDQGYVSTRMGFKRRFLLITDDNLDEVKKAAVNQPPQGGLANLTVCSAIALISQGVKILMLNHDELVFECEEEVAEETAKLVQSIMIKMGEKWYPEVSWRADVEIGNSWYDDRPEF